MPTKPVAPVRRTAPSGMSGGDVDTGFWAPAVERACVQAAGRRGRSSTTGGRRVTGTGPTGGTNVVKPEVPGAPPREPASEVVQRIRHRAVHPHLEVQMIAEAQAGAADVADDLALADVRAQRRAEAR